MPRPCCTPLLLFNRDTAIGVWSQPRMQRSQAYEGALAACGLTGKFLVSVAPCSNAHAPNEVSGTENSHLGLLARQLLPAFLLLLLLLHDHDVVLIPAVCEAVYDGHAASAAAAVAHALITGIVTIVAVLVIRLGLGGREHANLPLVVYFYVLNYILRLAHVNLHVLDDLVACMLKIGCIDIIRRHKEQKGGDWLIIKV